MLYRENGQFKSSYAADQQLLPIAQDRWFVLGLIAFAYLAVPALASDYMFRALIIPFVILAIAAIGLNILVGYCGQISIGTAAFMAVGAYAAYNLMIRVRRSLTFLIALAPGGRYRRAGRCAVRHTEPAHQGLVPRRSNPSSAVFHRLAVRARQMVHQLLVVGLGVDRADRDLRLDHCLVRWTSTCWCYRSRSC